MNRRLLLLVVLTYAAVLLVVLVFKKPTISSSVTPIAQVLTPAPTVVPTSKVLLSAPPISKTLNSDYHVFQTFNNCGPAALSMTLFYYGINENQQKLGTDLRPYQNSAGDNDDKSVTLDELVEKAKEYNLIPYYRPNGSIDLIKRFITYDMPVITRTWLKVDDDVGHFRVVKGYDDSRQQLIQDDSLQGKNLWYTYDNFNAIWRKFNYEYLVLVPTDKKEIAEAILGADADAHIAWGRAAINAEKEVLSNPDDVYARFNLSVAYERIGEYKRSVEEFEKIESKLSRRTLWYQIDPIQAYFALGKYDKVFALTDIVLNNGNIAFSELYLLRGQIYLKQGNKEAARSEFEKALFYNSNLKAAKDAVASVQ